MTKDFKRGSVPVKLVARIYGKNPEWVRNGIITGYLPIGIATRHGEVITNVRDINISKGRTNFYISPKLLYEHTGYVWKGEKE